MTTSDMTIISGKKFRVDQEQEERSHRPKVLSKISRVAAIPIGFHGIHRTKCKRLQEWLWAHIKKGGSKPAAALHTLIQKIEETQRQTEILPISPTRDEESLLQQLQQVAELASTIGQVRYEQKNILEKHWSHLTAEQQENFQREFHGELKSESGEVSRFSTSQRIRMQQKLEQLHEGLKKLQKVYWKVKGKQERSMRKVSSLPTEHVPDLLQWSEIAIEVEEALLGVSQTVEENLEESRSSLLYNIVGRLSILHRDIYRSSPHGISDESECSGRAYAKRIILPPLRHSFAGLHLFSRQEPYEEHLTRELSFIFTFAQAEAFIKKHGAQRISSLFEKWVVRAFFVRNSQELEPLLIHIGALIQLRQVHFTAFISNSLSEAFIKTYGGMAELAYWLDAMERLPQTQMDLLEKQTLSSKCRTRMGVISDHLRSSIKNQSGESCLCLPIDEEYQKQLVQRAREQLASPLMYKEVPYIPRDQVLVLAKKEEMEPRDKELCHQKLKWIAHEAFMQGNRVYMKEELLDHFIVIQRCNPRLLREICTDPWMQEVYQQIMQREHLLWIKRISEKAFEEGELLYFQDFYYKSFTKASSNAMKEGDFEEAAHILNALERIRGYPELSALYEVLAPDLQVMQELGICLQQLDSSGKVKEKEFRRLINRVSSSQQGIFIKLIFKCPRLGCFLDQQMCKEIVELEQEEETISAARILHKLLMESCYIPLSIPSKKLASLFLQHFLNLSMEARYRGVEETLDQYKKLVEETLSRIQALRPDLFDEMVGLSKKEHWEKRFRSGMISGFRADTIEALVELQQQVSRLRELVSIWEAVPDKINDGFIDLQERLAEQRVRYDHLLQFTHGEHELYEGLLHIFNGKKQPEKYVSQRRLSKLLTLLKARVLIYGQSEVSEELVQHLAVISQVESLQWETKQAFEMRSESIEKTFEKEWGMLGGWLVKASTLTLQQRGKVVELCEELAQARNRYRGDALRISAIERMEEYLSSQLPIAFDPKKGDRTEFLALCTRIRARISIGNVPLEPQEINVFATHLKTQILPLQEMMLNLREGTDFQKRLVKNLEKNYQAYLLEVNDHTWVLTTEQLVVEQKAIACDFPFLLQNREGLESLLERLSVRALFSAGAEVDKQRIDRIRKEMMEVPELFLLWTRIAAKVPLLQQYQRQMRKRSISLEEQDLAEKIEESLLVERLPGQIHEQLWRAIEAAWAAASTLLASGRQAKTSLEEYDRALCNLLCGLTAEQQNILKELKLHKRKDVTLVDATEIAALLEIRACCCINPMRKMEAIGMRRMLNPFLTGEWLYLHAPKMKGGISIADEYIANYAASEQLIERLLPSFADGPLNLDQKYFAWKTLVEIDKKFFLESSRDKTTSSWKDELWTLCERQQEKLQDQLLDLETDWGAWENLEVYKDSVLAGRYRVTEGELASYQRVIVAKGLALLVKSDIQDQRRQRRELVTALEHIQKRNPDLWSRLASSQAVHEIAVKLRI